LIGYDKYSHRPERGRAATKTTPNGNLGTGKAVETRQAVGEQGPCSYIQ
jgi:hypothetical protein